MKLSDKQRGLVGVGRGREKQQWAARSKHKIDPYNHILMKSTPECSEYVPKKTRTLLPSESSACPVDASVSLTQNTETARRQSLMGHGGACPVFFIRASKAEWKLALRMPLMRPWSQIIHFQGKLTSRTLPSHSVGSPGCLYPWQDMVSLIFIFPAAAVIRERVELFTARVLPTLSVLEAELTTEESGCCSYFHSENRGA